MKLLTAMFLVLCACGGGSAKKETASGKGKKGKAEVTKVEEGDGEGEGAGEAPEGDGGEDGGGKKSASKKPGKKGGSWGSGKARTCLDESRLPEGSSVRVAAAMEKDVLRVCYEAGEGEDVTRACVGVDPETGRGSRASIKPLAAADGTFLAGKLKTEGEKPEACSADDKCKALGKKAAKAAAAFATETGGKSQVTSDGALLALSSDAKYELWNVAKDKPVKVKAPKSVTKEYVSAADLTVIGNEVLLRWNPCAGPCTVTRRIDSKGKVLGADLDTEDVPHSYDDTRWVTLAGDLRVFDAKSGKQQHAIELFPDFPKYTVDGQTFVFGSDIVLPTPVVSLGDGRVAVMPEGEPVMAIANVDEGKLLSLYRLPLCEDRDAANDEDALRSMEKDAPAGAADGDEDEPKEKPAKASKSSKKKAAKKDE